MTSPQETAAPQPQIISAEDFREVVTPEVAREAIRRTLHSGFDPADDLPRRSEEVRHGSLLLMPSESAAAVGLKVLTVAPENPAKGRDLIQGLYLLFDPVTLELTHLLDGPALTDVRTPAVSMAALEPALLRCHRPVRAVVFGRGHQGRGHAAALRARIGAQPGLERLALLARSSDVERGSVFTDVVVAGSAEAEAALRAADIVICATSATTPLMDSRLLKNDVMVVAIGSHTPEARELDAALLERADVVVEDEATALRECGDVIQAIEEGALSRDDLWPLAEVVTGRRIPDPDRPYVFKGSGMPWQDLAVARAYLDAVRGGSSAAST